MSSITLTVRRLQGRPDPGLKRRLFKTPIGLRAFLARGSWGFFFTSERSTHALASSGGIPIVGGHKHLSTNVGEDLQITVL